MDEKTLHNLWQNMTPETLAHIYLDADKAASNDDTAFTVCESITDYVLRGWCVQEEQDRFEAVLVAKLASDRQGESR